MKIDGNEVTFKIDSYNYKPNVNNLYTLSHRIIQQVNVLLDNNELSGPEAEAFTNALYTLHQLAVQYSHTPSLR